MDDIFHYGRWTLWTRYRSRRECDRYERFQRKIRARTYLSSRLYTHYLTKHKHTQDVWEFGLISGGMNIGAFLFCWTTSPLTKRFGRRDVIGVASLLFALFAFVQGTADSFGHMFLGRILSGGTIAICATVVPMYVAELAPPEIRGGLVSLNQTAIGFAIMMIYWIALSLKDNGGSGLAEDWRVCFYISAIPALVLGIGIWFLPRSPRWLLMKNRMQDALQAMRASREGSSEEDIKKELEAMEASITREKSFRESTSCSALCKPSTTIQNITLTAFLIQLFQQIQGINVIMYFGPMVVDGFGLNGTLFTGVVQTFNFGFTFISVFTVDRIGRRPLLLLGTGIMFLSLFLVGIIGVANSTKDDVGDDERWVLRSKPLGYICIMCFVAYVIFASVHITRRSLENSRSKITKIQRTRTQVLGSIRCDLGSRRMVVTFGDLSCSSS